MWPFTSRISPQEKDQALALILHLQKMLAYQQLSMEIFNDSIPASLGNPMRNELKHSTFAIDSSNQCHFARCVLPALRRKLDILERLVREHQAFGRPVISQHAEVYDLFSAFFDVMKERGRLQIEEGTKWVTSPSNEIDALRLDDVEKQRMNKSLPALNKFIRKHGLSNEDFLQINCEAFNKVRQFVNLGPLSLEEFVDLYVAGMSGQRVRLFTGEG